MVATKRFRLAMETDEERTARLEKMVVTAQLRLALETGKKEEQNWIWIEIEVLRNELARPVMGTIFSSYVVIRTNRARCALIP